ncbi:hypothetical protein NPIL_493921 [Nephila pilipes]|uniref:Uncharacterized protein n=1 Tax=Nephila pilipes TaxID=299642 RepID=A0A8X6Q389_NEPPI|nr:hypothetical protein NPIL_493921 [Nephila pilipes]
MTGKNIKEKALKLRGCSDSFISIRIGPQTFIYERNTNLDCRLQRLTSLLLGYLKILQLFNFIFSCAVRSQFDIPRKIQLMSSQTPHSPIALVIDKEASATVASLFTFFRFIAKRKVRWNHIHLQHVLSSMKAPKQRTGIGNRSWALIAITKKPLRITQWTPFFTVTSLQLVQRKNESPARNSTISFDTEYEPHRTWIAFDPSGSKISPIAYNPVN